ncbi:unnamed protein product, partial [Ectocarpus sp. 13 AM-2016]
AAATAPTTTVATATAAPVTPATASLATLTKTVVAAGNPAKTARISRRTSSIPATAATRREDKGTYFYGAPRVQDSSATRSSAATRESKPGSCRVRRRRRTPRRRRWRPPWRLSTVRRTTLAMRW